MITRQLFDHDTFTYTYLLGDEKTGLAVIIDPVLEHVPQYEQLLEELRLKLYVALDTHTHADHISAIGALREKTHCLSMLGEQSLSECVSKTFCDKQKILVGNIVIEAIYTPGHTDDSYSFVVKDKGKIYLFTGDTLLIRGSGRTDFQQGNAITQFASITERLLTFPGDTIVYPGHDYRGWSQSTIMEEKTFNPRLQVETAEKYAEIMGSLTLPDPKLMDTAVPLNQRCGQL